MARRVGAMFGMVLILGLALFLMWRVYVHHKQTGGEDNEISVIARLAPELGSKNCLTQPLNI